MSNANRNARDRGKYAERIVGSIFKACGFPECKRRNADKGTACSDLIGFPFSVEVTRSKAGGGNWEKKFEQAKRNAILEGLPPLLAYLFPGRSWRRGIVVLYLGDFVTLLNKEETWQNRSSSEL